MNNGRIKVVIAKLSLDGHDRGAKIIAKGLSEAGMEVVYTGIKQTPEMVVKTVIQEDADVLGLSILSGAHMTLVPEVLRLLSTERSEKPLVILGGTIPKNDMPELLKIGVDRIYTAGATIAENVKYIHQIFDNHAIEE